MPSFDIQSEVDHVALHNAVDISNRKIANRYDFKGSDARLELEENNISLFAESQFQLEQVKSILLLDLSAKGIDTRCLDERSIQTISGNKVKQEICVQEGVEKELAKTITLLLKNSKLKLQSSIQGNKIRVNSAKRDILQQAIELVKQDITDFPLQFANFRD